MKAGVPGFRTWEGWWELLNARSVFQYDSEQRPSVCVLSLAGDKARALGRKGSNAGFRRSSATSNSIHAEAEVALRAVGDGNVGTPSTLEGSGSAQRFSVILVSHGEFVYALPEDNGGGLLKTLSFAPCHVTALDACDEGPMGVSVLVGLSNGDTVALDFLANCMAAGMKPSNVTVLSRPEEMKEDAPVVSCSFVPGLQSASQAMSIFANGTVAIYQVDAAGSQLDSFCKPSFGARRVNGAGSMPFSVVGSANRLPPLIKQVIHLPPHPPSPSQAPAQSPKAHTRTVVDSPFASDGGASYKTASSATGILGMVTGTWGGAASSRSPAPSVTCSALSPSGDLLACGYSDGTVAILELPKMRLKWGFTSYFGSVLALAWSPDSKIIAAGGQDDLVAMASAVHQSVMCWGEGHRSWVAGIAFDGRLCSLSARGPTDLLGNVYRVVSVGHDGNVAMWDLAIDEVLASAVPPPPPSTPGVGPAQGCAGDGVIQPTTSHRDMTMLLPLAVHLAHSHPAAAVAVIPLGVASLCHGGSLLIWGRPDQGAPTLKGHARHKSNTKPRSLGLK